VLQHQPHLRRKPLPLKASLQRKTHLKQTQSQPLSKRDLDDNDNLVIDDEITFGRNRNAEKFGKIIHEDELSDYIKFRLWLARQLALRKYDKTWT
jgi:hypothetical protein